MEMETVIFSTVMSDLEEIHGQRLLHETQGISIPFHRKRDYIDQVAIDLSKIKGFDVGEVSYNGEMLACVYGEYDTPNTYTRNLLVKKEEFREMLEYVHNTKIPMASEYLKQIRDASS